MKGSVASLAAALASLVLAQPGSSQVTIRTSVGDSGAQGDGASSRPSISSDGRYVAFASEAADLVPGDTNSTPDVFVRDRFSGLTARVSVATGGIEANDRSGPDGLAISADGRIVAFSSRATNLSSADTTSDWDVYVHDRASGTTELVSFVPYTHSAGRPALSADGRHVAFEATNWGQVYLYDRQLGTTELVSVGMILPPGHAHGWWYAYMASISADGRFVAFAADYEEALTGVPPHIYVRDRSTSTTEQLLPGSFYDWNPSISADGRYVSFQHASSHLVRRDRQASTHRSISAPGIDSTSISADGRFVAYTTTDWNPSGPHLFESSLHVRDFQNDTSETICGGLDRFTTGPVLGADGRYVAFSSQLTDLVPGDTNGVADVFVRNRLGGTRFESQCEPGVGAAACPCSNPPSGSERGCDNSAGTGGAALAASGGAFLSSDSLAFTTNGQRPSGTSMLVQGDARIPNGVVFGQGVRCADGALVRLFVKTASAGGITAPDFGAGDPQVSVRSAALGHPILPAEKRWYFVAYRDPIVLGGCPATSTFNATQTGQVTWAP